jgi:hypothetical protein
MVSFATTIATGHLFSSLRIYPPDGFRTTTGQLALDLFGAVFLSPVGETLILAAIIAIAARWLPRGMATLVGVALSAAAHGPAWWWWAVSSVAPFAIFAAPFVVRERWRDAIALSALTHAFHNLYALGLAILAAHAI